ncbi:MAG TPA: TadE/TadG family type IV pilus assembly protein [Anaerolineales bacterium]|nr:TadE/TadG family type IV pilus assembly protein [Anaerolineales bacterium]
MYHLKKDVWVHNGQTGQNLVEFAFGLVVLLLIAFGVMDLARVFHSIVVVTNASREGARFGTRNPDDLNGARLAALNEAQNAGVTLTLAEIAATCTDANTNGWCDGGQPIVVTVNHTFSTIFGNFFAASPLIISRTTQMMVP